MKTLLYFCLLLGSQALYAQTAEEWFEKTKSTEDVNIKIEYFGKAIELKPDFAEAYDNLGYSYYLKGTYDKALEYYEKVTELKYAGAYNNIGLVHFSKGLMIKS
jgi:tetratricopeptide (TPR) repeat protein